MKNNSLKIFFIVVFISMCITTIHVLNISTNEVINLDLFEDLLLYKYDSINNDTVVVNNGRYMTNISWTTINENVVISPYGTFISNGENAMEIPENSERIYVDLKIGGTNYGDYKVTLCIAVYNRYKELIDLKMDEITDVYENIYGKNALYQLRLHDNAKFYKIYLEILPLDSNELTELDMSNNGQVNISYLDVYFD